MLKRFILILISLIVGVAFAVPVSAVQSPVGCNSNRLNLSVSRDKLTVQQGDTLTYTITVSNLDSLPNIACDIDTATVTLRLPAANGTPTGVIVPVASNASYPAGTALTLVGTVPYVVNVNPDVVDITAEASVQGVLHDAPQDHAASITKTIGTAVIAATTPGSGGSNLPGLPNTGSY